MCAVIFDHTTLFVEDPEHISELRSLLGTLRSGGVRVAVFSTHRIPIQQRLIQYGYPPVDLFLCSDDLGGQRKGTGGWIQAASQRLQVTNHRMAYVGDDQQDWREAVNTGTFPIHARWSKPNHEKRPISIGSPIRLRQFLTHFIFPPARWQNRLDLPDRGVTYRGLMHPDSTLQSSDGTSFNLKSVFTYKHTYEVSGFDSHVYLLLHGMSNLYAEGLVPPGSWFTYYPGHATGAQSPMFQFFLSHAASFVHGYFKPNLLVRYRDAPDTSLARVRGERVTFATQARTVKVNDSYRGKLSGRTVIVFDDFSTSGSSLDWARTLITTAGAGRVIGMTVGKYPGQYSLHTPQCEVDPFGELDYEDEHFTCERFAVSDDHQGRAVTQEMNRLWVTGQDYPITRPTA